MPLVADAHTVSEQRLAASIQPLVSQAKVITIVVVVNVVVVVVVVVIIIMANT